MDNPISKITPLTRGEVLGLVFRLTVFGVTVYYGIKWIVDAADPTRKQKVEAKKRAERIMKRIGVEKTELTDYELTIASHLVDPTAINVSWDDIAGLDKLVLELRETVILPIQNRELFAQSDLIKPPKEIDLGDGDLVIACVKTSNLFPTGSDGSTKSAPALTLAFKRAKIPTMEKALRDDNGHVEEANYLISTTTTSGGTRWILLHGPPGCGKTMIAKATAKEACARFINLDISSLTDKWYGESQKLAASVFTLAVKIQPTIIFIDEIDSFLRARESHDHEATAMMKSQFMSLWDGLITDKKCHVIVMGATNRPSDVDRAILRRMPSMFHVDLPDSSQRKKILKLILQNENVSDSVNFEELASNTAGFSGSDLRELCRNAAIYRIRDYIATKDDNVSNEADLRCIDVNDFDMALAKMKKSRHELSGIPLD